MKAKLGDLPTVNLAEFLAARIGPGSKATEWVNGTAYSVTIDNAKDAETNLKRWAAQHKKTKAAYVRGTAVGFHPELTSLQEKILNALLILNATSVDSRKNKSELLPHVDKETKPTVLKEPLAALKRIGYVDSTGPRRGGGYWITPKGIERIKRQAKR